MLTDHNAHYVHYLQYCYQAGKFAGIIASHQTSDEFVGAFPEAAKVGIKSEFIRSIFTIGFLGELNKRGTNGIVNQ